MAKSSRSATSARIIRAIATIALAGCLLTANACSNVPDPAPGSSITSPVADPAAPTTAAPQISATAGSSPDTAAVTTAPGTEGGAEAVQTTADAAGTGLQGDAGVLDAGELGAAVIEPMPDLVGMPVTSAILALSNRSVDVTDASGATVTAAANDLVCRQTPAAGQPNDVPVILVVATTC